ncbi:MAG: hypothetical protein JW751_01675 [Polyangiaceae bacterium]|nr:hypothetical protein [Polyangiaceae bacterium]
MLEFVDEHSGEPDTRAVLAASVYTSPEVRGADGEVVVDPMYPEYYEAITDELDPLVAADYTPACNVCLTNPGGVTFASDATVGNWFAHLLGRGFRPRDVLSTEQTFTERVVPVMDLEGESVLIPVSQHYGLRSTVRVAQ